MSDTPDTDHLEFQLGRAATHSHPILWEHGRKMERERDEARVELEMWRDGNIMHQIHKDELEKTERERDEAREQAHRFRSLHYSHLGINKSASWFPWERHE
jgi:hypothetical protein